MRTRDGYQKDREARGFGSNNGPKHIKSLGDVTVTALAMNHIRSKSSGRWGVSALLLCVDGPEAGSIHVHDMWTPAFVDDLVYGAANYEGGYNDVLPGENDDPDEWEPPQDALDFVLKIVTCGDQHEKGKWRSTVPPEKRRTPYMTAVMKEDGQDGKYRKVKFFRALAERGTDGPYYVSTYRDAFAAADRKGAIEWFDAKCEAGNRKAAEEAAKRRGAGGGGGGDGDPTADDEIPF